MKNINHERFGSFFGNQILLNRIFVILSIAAIACGSKSFAQEIEPKNSELYSQWETQTFNDIQEYWKSARKATNDYPLRKYPPGVELIPKADSYRQPFNSTSDSIAQEWTLDRRWIRMYDLSGQLNSEKESWWDLANTVWVDEAKVEYLYDDHGNTIEEIQYAMYGDSEIWVGQKRFNWSYDSLGNLLEDAKYVWDNNRNNWKGIEKQSWTYDSWSFLTREITYVWISEGAYWANEDKQSWEYDSLGNNVEHRRYYWDTQNQQWGNETKEENEFDSNGDLVESIGYIWDNEQNNWLSGFRLVITYDKSKVHESITYIWNVDQSEWLPGMKEEYKYDESGYQIEYGFYNWDTDSDAWICRISKVITNDENGYPIEIIFTQVDFQGALQNWGKHKVRYDNLGNIIEYTIYTWDMDNENWTEDSKSVYEFDIEGNMTKRVCYVWNVLSASWKKEHDYSYSFSPSGKLIESSYYAISLVNGEWQGKRRTTYAYDSNDSIITSTQFRWDQDTTWTEIKKKEYFYDTDANTVEILAYFKKIYIGIDQEITSKSIRVFPNPSSGSITLDIGEVSVESLKLEIINLSGKSVYSQLLKQPNSSTIINFPDNLKGVFILMIHGNRIQGTEKLIIQ